MLMLPIMLPIMLMLHGRLMLHAGACARAQDGVITEEEFVKELVNCGLAASDDDIRAVFKAFDTDDSNTIEYSEMCALEPPHSSTDCMMIAR